MGREQCTCRSDIMQSTIAFHNLRRSRRTWQIKVYEKSTKETEILLTSVGMMYEEISWDIFWYYGGSSGKCTHADLIFSNQLLLSSIQYTNSVKHTLPRKGLVKPMHLWQDTTYTNVRCISEIDYHIWWIMIGLRMYDTNNLCTEVLHTVSNIILIVRCEFITHKLPRPMGMQIITHIIALHLHIVT